MKMYIFDFIFYCLLCKSVNYWFKAEIVC